MSDIKVLRDFVAVKRLDQPKSATIEIVRFDDRLLIGEVVEKGTGVLTANGQAHEIEVNIGDTVVFDKMNAREITHKNVKYLIVNELSILAVLL